MTDTLVVVMGIFVVTAFSAVIVIQQKKGISVGYWPLIGAVGAFMTLAELFAIGGNEDMRRLFIIISLFIFGLVALMRFWETMSIAQY